jgi:hypothetical protein
MMTVERRSEVEELLAADALDRHDAGMNPSSSTEQECAFP